MSNRIVYSIIVPLYNKELVINESYIRLKKLWILSKKIIKLYLLMMAVMTREKVEEMCASDKK